MTYTKDSVIVKTWVSLVMAGAYTAEQVPNLFNLRAVVQEVLNTLK
nr:MAG TPA: hypothetical protein [Caudoviricetes sp.]